MKKILVSLTIFTFLFLPLRSYGNISEVRIQRIVLLTAVACAVNLQVLNIVGNQFNGSETLFFGNTAVGNLLALVGIATIINDSFLLFASPSFEQSEGITADVQISDADCALMQAGSEISFVGSFGATIAAVTILAGFIFNFAMVFLLSTNGYDIFDLALFSLLINSLVAEVIIGTGTLINEGFDDGGGCAIAKHDASQKSNSWMLWGFLALGSLGWGIRRRVSLST